MIVYLVGVEVRGSDVDIEQVVSTSELQGSGFRQRPGPGLQDVGDVGAPATPGPGRRSRGRGSNFGSRAWHASGLGWRPCWPLCNQTPNSKIGDGDYVGQDGII